jgi:hypothetical protein
MRLDQPFPTFEMTSENLVSVEMMCRSNPISRYLSQILLLITLLQTTWSCELIYQKPIDNSVVLGMYEASDAGEGTLFLAPT